MSIKKHCIHFIHQSILHVCTSTYQAYFCRQVVTNSKGEKVEVLWPSATYDEMTMMVFGNAPIWEMHENPWDPIPGELPTSCL